MPRFLRALGLFLVLFGASAQAQQAIPFDEAIRIALEQNAGLQQAALTDEASELNVSSARVDALPLPFISASISPAQRYGLSFDQTTGQLVSQTSESLNLGVNASVDLFDGFRSRRTLEQARIQRSASALNLERRRQEVAFDVASRFLQVMLDREIVSIRAQNLEAQEVQLSQVEALVESGVRASADIYSQRASVALAQSQMLQAEQAVELSQTRLVEVLHLDPLGSYTFTTPDVQGESIVPEDVSLDELLAAAYDGRTDLMAQDESIRAAETGVSVARSGRLPSIALQAGINTGYSSLQQQLANPLADPVSIPLLTESGEPVLLAGEPFAVQFQGDPELERTPFFSQLADNRGGSIGLSVSIPIFDRYSTSRQVQQAQIEVRRQEIIREQMRQSIAVEVQQAVIDYRNAAAQLDLSAVQVEATEAALQAEQDRYELGTGTLVALEQARARHTEALSNRAQAVYQFVFRSKLIDFSLGNLDPHTALFD